MSGCLAFTLTIREVMSSLSEVHADLNKCHRIPPESLASEPSVHTQHTCLILFSVEEAVCCESRSNTKDIDTLNNKHYSTTEKYSCSEWVTHLVCQKHTAGLWVWTISLCVFGLCASTTLRLRCFRWLKVSLSSSLSFKLFSFFLFYLLSCCLTFPTFICSVSFGFDFLSPLYTL